MENRLFMCKPNNNSGFPCPARENLAKYVVCGKVRIPRATKFMTQTRHLVIYPAGICGKVTPHSDSSGHRLGTTAAGPSAAPASRHEPVARQWGAGAAVPSGPDALRSRGAPCTLGPAAPASCPPVCSLVLRASVPIPSSPSFQPLNGKHQTPECSNFKTSTVSDEAGWPGPGEWSVQMSLLREASGAPERS